MLSRRRLLGYGCVSVGGAALLGWGSISEVLRGFGPDQYLEDDEVLDCERINYSLQISWKDEKIRFTYDDGEEREEKITIDGALMVETRTGLDDILLYLDEDEREARVETELECSI